MKALFFTNEYPPNIYGGAGVHVEYLARELARLIEVEVRCFGSQSIPDGRPAVQGFGLDASGFSCPKALTPVLGALQRNLDFVTNDVRADVVHCHTWYAHFAGILAKLNYGLPLVITVHSLEPLRPWKREQLGGGYDFTLWLERTALQMADAVIAVSRDTAEDIRRLIDVSSERLHVIHNGIDLQEYQPTPGHAVRERYGIQGPFVLFVGRITRQKGIVHLVRAARYLDPGFTLVLCAGAPDTPEIAREMKEAVEEVQRERGGVVWIESMLDNASKIQLYSEADVFVCPSIYEPFGIINLEAMACETAVVASAVGGIPEVVVDGETGFLVPVEQMQESPFEPLDPDRFARELARRVNELMADETLRRRFAQAGRERVLESFGWGAVAERTELLYRSVLK